MENGTDKQKAFAVDIKSVFVKGYNLINGKVDEKGQKILDEILNNEDSFFWIENRNNKEIESFFSVYLNENEEKLEEYCEDTLEEIERLEKDLRKVFDSEYHLLRQKGELLYK